MTVAVRLGAEGGHIHRVAPFGAVGPLRRLAAKAAPMGCATKAAFAACREHPFCFEPAQAGFAGERMRVP